VNFYADESKPAIASLNLGVFFQRPNGVFRRPACFAIVLILPRPCFANGAFATRRFAFRKLLCKASIA
jgi:hypothetical protein